MAQSAHPPDDLARWELHAYCLGAVQPPGPVVRSGANGRLLHAAREGMNWRGVVDEDRIATLERLGLIDRTGDRIQTSFPIIGPDAAASLRRRARDLAAGCLPCIFGPAGRIRERLTADSLAGHAHAILFGHVLDGLMWSILARQGAIPDTRPTAERPFWNGTFWAIWPPRAEPAGVNEAAFGDMRLVMVWTDRTEARLKQFASRDGLEEVLRAALDGDRTVACAPEWGLVDDRGRLRFPVISAGDGAALNHESLAMAQAVADALLTEALPRIQGVADPRDLRVIFGHELIWELSDRLREAGLFARPPGDDPIHDIFLRVESF